jgi:photosystem II stability/assembly factor-like uncharacterized protein
MTLKILILLIFSQSISSQIGWNWQNPFPTGKHLKSIKFTDVNNGFAVGYDGSLLKTTNSGINWNLEYITNVNIWSLFFINSQTGFVSGESGVILKTTNAGLSWSQKVTNTTQKLVSIFFCDLNTGYSAGTAGTVVGINQCGKRTWCHGIRNIRTNKQYSIY